MVEHKKKEKQRRASYLLMIIQGISQGFHDAAVCYIKDGEILYASHSERYSKRKGDKRIHKDQIQKHDKVAYYEKPFKTNLRRLFSGQSWKKCNIDYDVSYSHHQTHAAAGYYTQ